MALKCRGSWWFAGHMLHLQDVLTGRRICRNYSIYVSSTLNMRKKGFYNLCVLCVVFIKEATGQDRVVGLAAIV